jgi:hypothetical protein
VNPLQVKPTTNKDEPLYQVYQCTSDGKHYAYFSYKKCRFCVGIDKPTPAQQSKAAGLKNLTQVSELTGTSLNTLTNWHKNKPKLFAVVLSGCLAIVNKEE